MEAPVDRVENASRSLNVPARVRKTSESAKEKDDPFTKVLREKMEEEPQEKQKREDKQKDDELLLSKKSVELAKKAGPDKQPPVTPDAESSEDNESQSDQSESIDLTA